MDGTLSKLVQWKGPCPWQRAWKWMILKIPSNSHCGSEKLRRKKSAEYTVLDESGKKKTKLPRSVNADVSIQLQNLINASNRTDST